MDKKPKNIKGCDVEKIAKEIFKADRGLAYLYDPSDVHSREKERIDAQKINELQLAKLKMVVKATKIGLWDMEIVRDDPVNNTNKITWSDEFRQILGFTDEGDFPNVIESFHKQLHPEDFERVTAAVSAHMLDATGNTPYDIEYRVIKKGGETAYIRATGETIRSENGSPIRIAGAIMDITESKNALFNIEKLMVQAQSANKAKSEFLANMSHEIRTPMNAINGMTAIGKSATDVQRKDYCFGKIEDASRHLLGVINDILDMSKIEANKFELSETEFNYARMLQRVINITAFRSDEKDQIITVHIDDAIPRILIGDDQRLAQVITNLLSNAVKFTPNEGFIKVDTELVGEHEGDYTINVTVTDSGIGISPKQQEQLFKAFRQADSTTSRLFGGSGLGLVISKSIIEMMGGQIKLKSEVGKGSEFSFTFKAKRGSYHPNGHNSHHGAYDCIDGIFDDCRILITEDVAVNTEIIEALIEPTGLKSEAAENGIAAVKKFEQSGAGYYDLILMDVQMPEMDGYEATGKIRESAHPDAKTIPIVAMTANVFRESVERCLASGMNAHIGKPFDIDELFGVLRKYLI